MGYLANPGHEEVQKTIAAIEKKVLASDKFLGTIAPTWDKAQACYEKGYQWMILMQDSTALAALAAETAAKFRETYEE